MDVKVVSYPNEHHSTHRGRKTGTRMPTAGQLGHLPSYHLHPLRARTIEGYVSLLLCFSIAFVWPCTLAAEQADYVTVVSLGKYLSDRSGNWTLTLIIIFMLYRVCGIVSYTCTVISVLLHMMSRPLVCGGVATR